MAAQGYDSICIDIQHGALDYNSALLMLQAMRASNVVPLVRVPWLEPGIDRRDARPRWDLRWPGGPDVQPRAWAACAGLRS
jgi:hypothetical protein